jgi:hypothetical protein
MGENSPNLVTLASFQKKKMGFLKGVVTATYSIQRLFISRLVRHLSSDLSFFFVVSSFPKTFPPSFPPVKKTFGDFGLSVVTLLSW